jgi:hypothetical protein
MSFESSPVSPVTSKIQDLYGDEDGAVDPVYKAKAHALNEAIQEIGMGRYQWYLWIVAGFGWFAYVYYNLLPSR